VLLVWVQARGGDVTLRAWRPAHTGARRSVRLAGVRLRVFRFGGLLTRSRAVAGGCAALLVMRSLTCSASPQRHVHYDGRGGVSGALLGPAGRRAPWLRLRGRAAQPLEALRKFVAACWMLRPPCRPLTCPPRCCAVEREGFSVCRPPRGTGLPILMAAPTSRVCFHSVTGVGRGADGRRVRAVWRAPRRRHTPCRRAPSRRSCSPRPAEHRATWSGPRLGSPARVGRRSRAPGLRDISALHPACAPYT
jgi:hypothetical protein